MPETLQKEREKKYVGRKGHSEDEFSEIIRD